MMAFLLAPLLVPSSPAALCDHDSMYSVRSASGLDRDRNAATSRTWSAKVESERTVMSDAAVAMMIVTRDE